MKLKASQIKVNPNNPRLIKDDKFKKLVNSIKELPKMAEVRPVVVDGDYMVLGGNMRFKAMVEAGWSEIPVIVLDDTWSDEEKKQFIIKDNVSGGEWDWDILANEWDTEMLAEWGVDFPIYDEPEINLPDGEKDGFQQMTFTLADQQADVVKQAINNAKGLISGDEENENSNGNALYYVAKAFNERS